VGVKAAVAESRNIKWLCIPRKEIQIQIKHIKIITNNVRCCQ